MPELPEVETIRRQLVPALHGCELVDAGSHWSSKFTPALDAIGHEISGIRRRGKYLLIDLAGPDGTTRELVVHLGMTGRLAVEDDPDLTHPHLRAWWRLDVDRVLTFHDARRFGRIHVVATGDHAGIPTLAALGPEPFDDAFDGRALAAFVQRSNRHLKTILLGQRAVAGIGNIYADEALWMAGINPATRRLGRARADRLVAAGLPARHEAGRRTMSTPSASEAPTSTSSTATDAAASPANVAGRSWPAASSMPARPRGVRGARPVEDQPTERPARLRLTSRTSRPAWRCEPNTT